MRLELTGAQSDQLARFPEMLDIFAATIERRPVDLTIHQRKRHAGDLVTERPRDLAKRLRELYGPWDEGGVSVTFPTQRKTMLALADRLDP